MTQTSTTAQTGPYNGNGSTVAFDYDFRILADADIVVTLTSAAGLDTVKTLTTDYTVSGAGSASGGTVTMNVAPATGEKLTLTRATTLTQTLDLQNRKVVSPELLEDALDKLTLAAQDLDARVDRSVKISVASDAADLDTLLANINGLAALESEIGTLAGISSDITTVSGISANVTTVAGVAANVTTIAGISADVSDVAAIDSAVSTVAGIDSDVTTLAGLSAEIQILAAGGAVSLSVFGITATAAELNELDGVSSIGGDLVRAADAAAQRTVLGLGDLAVLNTVDTAQIASGEQMTTTNVNTAIASSTVGGVGTYAFLGASNGLTVAYGGTTAGSGLNYRGVTNNPFDTNGSIVAENAVNPAGTWRAMGILAPYGGGSYPSATLFLRIA